jgi:hypothetical protein
LILAAVGLPVMGSEDEREDAARSGSVSVYGALIDFLKGVWRWQYLYLVE